ncbi:MAG: AAA family ATPase [Phycisphaerales bacterium]|nr:AAA family ATPase [Phycisphaerales bacterium]
MMLNIGQLRERLALRFPDAEQVEEFVIRFTRKSNGHAFALYYVDVGSHLPTTREALTDYQDRVIGKRYFEGKKSLQWSNYLYFVVSAEQARTSAMEEAKQWIELDRTYARKFVITESELDAAFGAPPSASPDALPEASIHSVWLAKLTEVGLDKAVLSDKPLPSRLALIETASATPSPPPTVPTPQPSLSPLPFLKSLQLAKFREFPLQRDFAFGTVNLIVGANGSGKTSLLEAIELLYCGRNKRNAHADGAYDIAAVFADGSKETATHTRPQKTFRQRNLHWYGQPEVKTNNLYLSFALFNFLDTDAAVGLAESTARLDDDLSNLLVGSEASKTWREIERLHDATTAKLRELRPLETQIKSEIVTLDARLKEAGSVKQESDSILTRVEDMVRRLKWPAPTKDKAEFPELLLESLPELESLAMQAAAFEWAASPTSADGLKKYSSDAKKACERAEADIERLEEHRKKERRLVDQVRRFQSALTLIADAARVVDAGLPDRAEELRKLQNAVTSHGGLLAGSDDTLLTVLAKSQPEATVVALAAAAKAARTAAQKAVNAAKEEHACFTRLRDHSVSLAQQLRDIAAQILQVSPLSEECPLCHTQFAPGELAKHMQLGVDQHVEARGQVLLSQLRQREEALRQAVIVENASTWLGKFCERAAIDGAVTVVATLSKIEGARQALVEAQRRLEALNKELQALESQGLPVAMLDQLLVGLRDSGHALADWTKETIDQVRGTIERDQASAARTLEEERSKAAALQRSLEAGLGLGESSTESLKVAVSQLKERRAVADSLREKLGTLLKSFPWPGDRPLSELVVETDSIRKVAAEFQAVLGREQQAKTIFAESTKRREQLAKQLAEVSPRIERLVKAGKALEAIQTNHSLTGAMEAALKRNRAQIEMIFGRIHAPAEFSGLGGCLSTLVRKNRATEATLSEISTGQRAAFALSIFLAQNAQLRAAPPVVLIDDPIAHVDDLNALSFLDYLRELALAGSRQILFATASEKLATLFERKFDFLGDGFRRHDLRR